MQQDDFFSNINGILRKAADICHDKIQEIPCITCPMKPEGGMFVMVKLNLSLLEDVKDDMEFCVKLAKEEAVIVLPGTAVGKKDWLRITFAIEPAALEAGLERIKVFLRKTCQECAKTEVPFCRPQGLILVDTSLCVLEVTS